MRRILLAIGSLLVLFALVWAFVISDRFTDRFTEDWTWDVNILGVTAFADEETGQFPETPMEEDAVNITERHMTVTKVDGDTVEIEDDYRTFDPATNVVIWEFAYSAEVDAETSKHTTEDYRNDYFIFPPDTEKKTYNIRNSTYQGVPMEFDKEEEVSDLTTYKFTYKADMVNTVAYDYIELEEGQQVICYGFELNYWVEPRTGEIVKYREWCPGDYVIDENGERLYGLQRWGGETTGDDLIRRTEVIEDRLNTLNLYNLYIPLATGAVGVVALVMGVVPPMFKKPENG